MIECSRTQIYLGDHRDVISTNGSNSFSAEINVTPLIDVLLVLLIIFMVIVPLAPLGLGASIPTPGQPTASAATQAPLLIEVRGNAVHPLYRVNGIGVDGDALTVHIRDLMLTRANHQMLVKANPDLDFGTVSKVVDQGWAAGADTVGLLTLGSSR